jgi:hypothetical protein
MLSLSDTSVYEAQKLFSELGLDVAFLVPTPNGYQKSIMDATLPLRVLLAENKVHDYLLQKQGQENKASIPAFFIYENDSSNTVASLYRPETKNGDPRIWFKDLRSYCEPQNLLAILTDGEKIFVVNLSNNNIWQSLVTRGYVFDVLSNLAYSISIAAAELRDKIEKIHHMGYLPSVTRGDTGVGMTLEHYLGITPNALKTPDYKGIEIKASRKKVNPTRVNLFSQVPDWSGSNIKSANELLQNYGYERNGRLQLYCTVRSNIANPQGLLFKIDNSKDTLHNLAAVTKEGSGLLIHQVVQWDLSLLRKRLLEKHNATFWVKAKSRVCEGKEEFLYESVIYTREPSVVSFIDLIDCGKITMDYTLSDLGNRVRDHGYLFKIFPNDIPLLFPPPIEYCF